MDDYRYDLDIDEEEEFRRAIELSLQDQIQRDRQPNSLNSLNSQQGTSRQNAIDLENDRGHTTADTSAMQKQRDDPAKTGAKQSSGCSSFLGLNRKAMEQERLERLRQKRNAPPGSPPPVQSTTNPYRDGTPTTNTARSGQLSPYQSSTLQKSPAINKSVGSSTSNSGPVYLDGSVKKTWAFRHDRIDDVKIEEVLQPNDLTAAVLSSFQWDIGWLWSKLDVKRTQTTLVMQAKDDSVKRQYERQTASMPNLRLCFPSMEGEVNCMHSKLMLLAHPTHLRIVVPTANLVPYDWGETGVMENMVFLIDLPRLPDAKETPKERMTRFGQDLVYFLEAMGLEDSLVQSIYNFDFSRTNEIAFVHSIGGPHVGKDEPWRRTGFCGLGRAIHDLGLKNDGPLSIDLITSSLGALNLDFLTMLYLAAQGDDGLTGYQLINSRVGRAKASQFHVQQSKARHEQIQQQIIDNMRIYFPTRNSVAMSTGGPSSGGTICFQRKWYTAPTFPQSLLRDCKSQRPGLLMHNKILFVRPNQPPSFPTSPSSSPQPRAWTYVGSANCSESAWGKLTQDRTTHALKLTCRNWECGVVLPVRGAPAPLHKLDDGSSTLSVFEGTLPVPMQVPGREYGREEEGDEPWFYMEEL